MPPPKNAMKQISSVDNRLAVVHEFARLWQQFGQFFIDGLPPERTIRKEEEDGFFQILNLIALNHYRFTELASPYFKEGEKMLKVLTETVSLEVVKGMSEAQFNQLSTDWHEILIFMHKSIGKLLPLKAAAK